MAENDTITWEAAVRSLIDDPSRRDLVEACYFDLPLIEAARRYAEGIEWRSISEFLDTPKGIAVDIGAGNGIVSYALARDGWSVVAVEPDHSDLVGAGAIRGLATASGLSIEVREGFGEGLPLADGEANVVIVRQVLHHARDLGAFCGEIARVLAPGGQLIAVRDHVAESPSELAAFLAKHPLHDLYGGEHAFSLAEYRNALIAAELKIEKELGSFASPINYAPLTRQSIISLVSGKFGPAKGLISKILSIPGLFNGVLWLLTKVDRRPGRLVSFICRKQLRRSEL